MSDTGSLSVSSGKDVLVCPTVRGLRPGRLTTGQVFRVGTAWFSPPLTDYYDGIML